jgi:hypothetical protein
MKQQPKKQPSICREDLLFNILNVAIILGSIAFYHQIYFGLTDSSQTTAKVVQSSILQQDPRTGDLTYKGFGQIFNTEEEGK